MPGQGEPRPRPDIAEQGSDQGPRIVETLSRAFADDPAMAWIMPDRADRTQRLRKLFALLVREDLNDGWCLASPGCEAVTLWRAQATTNAGLLGLLRGLPGFVAALGPNIFRALTISNAVEHHHPRGLVYDYLHFAGVDPAYQGQGWGGAAIRAGLARARQSGRPVYLETATESNVGLYQSQGFEVIEEWDVPRGGPHFWSMLWRAD